MHHASQCVCVRALPVLGSLWRRSTLMLNSGTSAACLGHFTEESNYCLSRWLPNASFPFFLPAQRNPKAACDCFVTVLWEALSKGDFPFPQMPLWGLEKDPEKKLQISSLLYVPVVCKPSTGWSIHGSVPLSCHLLGALGCTCWFDLLCPCWGAHGASAP